MYKIQQLQVIGITGKMRSGKDSLAFMLKNKLKPYFQTILIIKFAEPLKLIVLSGLGYNITENKLHTLDEQLKNTDSPFKPASILNLIQSLNSELKKHNLSLLTEKEKQTILKTHRQPAKETYRFLLQFIGTDIFRKRKKDFWIIQTINRIKTFLLKNPDSIIIVSDIRFPDEAKALRENFSSTIIKTIKIIRTGYFNCTHTEHSSETSVDLVTPDIIILASNLKELETGAEKVIEKLEEQKKIFPILFSQPDQQNLLQHP